MSTQIQRRRGTTAEHSTFTGVEGELTVDTTKDTAVVHDGTTVGGHPLQKQYPPLGSAAAPTYTFTGDTNTGIYSPGADQVAVATNGTGRLFVDSSGNVGIGTTSPGYALDVKTSAETAIRIDSGSSSNAILRFAQAGVNKAFIQYPNGGGLRFGPAGSEAARIDSSGRLLVGTSTARSNFFNTAQATALQLEGTGTAGASFSITSNQADGAGAPFLILGRTNSGSVGGNGLVSDGNQVGAVSFQAADGSELVPCASISANVDGTPGANDMPGRLVFSTTADGASSPTERMRIDNQGRIGFDYPNIDGVLVNWGYGGYRGFASYSNSTTLSAQRASWFLRGSLQSSNDELANCILLLQDTGGAASNKGDLIKGYSGTTFVFRVANNGAVQNQPNSYGAISDQRLKQNIEDAGSQWDDIKQVQVRKFRFCNEPEVGPYIGVIAQEVEAVSPGLVDQALLEDGNPDPEGFKSVKYSVLYMKAVKALQEAMARIETLEGMVAVNNITIDEQQHQLSTLAARLTALETP